MFRFPESVKLDINEDRIYAVVWDFLMRLQEELPRALMYYGVRDEEGREKNTATLGIFLPFHHFERKMEKISRLQTVSDWDAGNTFWLK